MENTGMKLYNIYYLKFSIIAHGYIPYVTMVETLDIYHEIGKLICESFEAIRNIRYTEIKDDAHIQQCKELWEEHGYVRLLDTSTWYKTQPNGDYYDIKDFVADIDVTKATKMAVVVFNDDDTTECGYYNMNLKDKAQAKHELEIDIIDNVIRANKDRYFEVK